MNELRDVEAQFVPLDSLKAYDGNAKKHDSDNIDAIANSIWHCACVELDPHYASVIVDRWEKLTGGKAEKIEE